MDKQYQQNVNDFGKLFSENFNRRYTHFMSEGGVVTTQFTSHGKFMHLTGLEFTDEEKERQRSSSNLKERRDAIRQVYYDAKNGEIDKHWDRYQPKASFGREKLEALEKLPDIMENGGYIATYKGDNTAAAAQPYYIIDQTKTAAIGLRQADPHYRAESPTAGGRGVYDMVSVRNIESERDDYDYEPIGSISSRRVYFHDESIKEREPIQAHYLNRQLTGELLNDPDKKHQMLQPRDPSKDFQVKMLLEAYNYEDNPLYHHSSSMTQEKMERQDVLIRQFLEHRDDDVLHQIYPEIKETLTPDEIEVFREVSDLISAGQSNHEVSSTASLSKNDLDFSF